MRRRSAHRRRASRAGLFLLGLAALMLAPEVAWAWGPAAHIDFALEALLQASLLTPGLRALLENYADDYLYGTCAADMIIGKNMAREAHHCHNWKVAGKLLEVADTDRRRALCWGFLSHLAADVVAHNYYVPVKIVQSYRSRVTLHAYWELRYDETVYGQRQVWNELKRIGRLRFPEHDRFLRDQLAKASRLMPFETSRRIFNSLMFLGRAERWKRTAGRMAGRSNWRFSDHEVVEIRKLGVASVVGLLVDQESSRAWQADPTGAIALGTAKKLRKGLKKLRRAGKIDDELPDESLDLLRQSFRPLLGGRKSVLPGVSDLVTATGGA